MAQTQSRKIGVDHVLVKDERLIVITPVEMPDWDVRQHRATLIRFEEQTWRVASKTRTAGKTHYELVRWVPHDHDVPGREIHYNTAYVALRDQHPAEIRAKSRVTGIFRVISPLVGFLPARTKARLETNYGVDAVATTFQSVFLEFLISLGSFVWTVIALVVSAHAGGQTFNIPIRALVVIGTVSAVDAAMRYDRILAEQRPLPGFYEWLVMPHPVRPR